MATTIVERGWAGLPAEGLSLLAQLLADLADRLWRVEDGKDRAPHRAVVSRARVRLRWLSHRLQPQQSEYVQASRLVR